jgi:hypothetical protein
LGTLAIARIEAPIKPQAEPLRQKVLRDLAAFRDEAAGKPT